MRLNGKSRSTEEPENICSRLIETVWGWSAKEITRTDGDEGRWMKLHESARDRRLRKQNGSRTPRVAPGHKLRVTFSETVEGPIIVGDSAHFGLGLFQAVE
jgi:CRISPR-associated protein Csb2